MATIYLPFSKTICRSVRIIIRGGTIEDNRAMQLRSRVMIDDKLSAGSAFGANGTPMGVLVDAKGRIASDVVAGARAVMALANA